jgi:hypothetical protein
MLDDAEEKKRPHRGSSKPGRKKSKLRIGWRVIPCYATATFLTLQHVPTIFGDAIG